MNKYTRNNRVCQQSYHSQETMCGGENTKMSKAFNISTYVND